MIAATDEVRHILRKPWFAVRCPRCGRFLCEIRAGGAVKVSCKRCKAVVIRDAE